LWITFFLSKERDHAVTQRITNSKFREEGSEENGSEEQHAHRQRERERERELCHCLCNNISNNIHAHILTIIRKSYNTTAATLEKIQVPRKSLLLAARESWPFCERERERERERREERERSMANRLRFEGSNEIGVFTRLTNNYCLVTSGGPPNFYNVLESELSEHIPVVR